MIDTMWIIEPWHWLVLGFLLLIVEMFVLTFATLWFGVAAVIVAALTWLLPISILWQVLIWLVLSVIFMFAWFKYIKPLSIDRTKAGLGGSVIIGETGMIVVKPHSDKLGRVRFSVPIVGADEWFCRTHDEEVEVGDRVVVTDIIGNELIVAPTQQTASTQRIAAPVNVTGPAINKLRINDVDHHEIKHSKLSLHKAGLDRARLEKKFTDN